MEFTEHAAEAGARPLFCTSCPTTTSRRRKACYRHFEAIDNAVDIPIIIYNIPRPLHRWICRSRR
ncbi:MAG: hypothetical protein ACMVO3_15450 [Thalassobaculum sp.]